MPGFRKMTIVLSAVLALGLVAAIAIAQESLPEKLVANAINMGAARGMGAGQGGLVQITINRWSTPEERQTLVDAFRQKGGDGLLAALQDLPSVGKLHTPNTLGWDIHYAIQKPSEDGGRRIIIATDRSITFWEASRSTRSADYSFTLVEMRLGANGKGEGRMSLATRVALSKDGKNVELENYGSDPVRLQNVRKQK